MTCSALAPGGLHAPTCRVTLGFGLLWLAGVLVLDLLVSRRAPLPARLLRFQESVRPAAFAMVVLLLAYVVLGWSSRWWWRRHGACRRRPSP